MTTKYVVDKIRSVETYYSKGTRPLFRLEVAQILRTGLDTYTSINSPSQI